MFELSGVNYEEVLEQGDSILVRVIASSSYRGFELSGVRVIGIILYMYTCLSRTRMRARISPCPYVCIRVYVNEADKTVKYIIVEIQTLTYNFILPVKVFTDFSYNGYIPRV